MLCYIAQLKNKNNINKIKNLFSPLLPLFKILFMHINFANVRREKKLFLALNYNTIVMSARVRWKKVEEQQKQQIKRFIAFHCLMTCCKVFILFFSHFSGRKKHKTFFFSSLMPCTPSK
jgi:hypothetical protein